MKRRNLVRESWLLLQTNTFSRQLQSSLNDSQREQLTLRLVRELAEFMLPAQVKEGESQGRISGDINWRQTRGELGFEKRSKPVVWIPTETEINSGEFEIAYRCSISDVKFFIKFI